jgi:hypothetical protein
MDATPHSAWALRADLVVATSPEFGCAHQNMRVSAEWEASSPCADDMHMQTDSPSNMKTPVPEGRHGMEVRARSLRMRTSTVSRAAGAACVTSMARCVRADGHLAHAAGAAIAMEEDPPRLGSRFALRR